MKDHTHKYIRGRMGKDYIIFKCAVPGCTHYIPKALADGRKSICWVCGEEMFLNKRSLELKKPHHFECTKKKDESETMAEDFIAKILGGGAV